MSVSGKQFKIAVGVFFILLIAMRIQAKAAEEIPENSLWQISRNVEVKEEAAESAEKVGNLEKGTPVIVLENVEDNWCKIQYQEILGYVQRDCLEAYGIEQSEALEQEFMQVQEENIQFEDEYDLEQEQVKSTDIWKAMIIVFIVAIFGIGIFSALKGNKEDDSD